MIDLLALFFEGYADGKGVCHWIGARYNGFDTSSAVIADGRDGKFDKVPFIDLQQIALGDLRFDLQVIEVDEDHHGKTGHDHISHVKVLLDDDPVTGALTSR